MGKGVGCYDLHVIGRDVAAPPNGSEGLRTAVQPESSPRAGSQLHVFMPPGGLNQPDDIVAQHRVNIDILDLLLAFDNVIASGDGLHDVYGVGGVEPGQHLLFISLVGVAQTQAKHKAVQLRLGQGKGSLPARWGSGWLPARRGQGAA